MGGNDELEVKMKKYDVVVVGSGAGNIVLDAALAQGLQCAQIEKGRFGGTCLTRGCIPTKVMVTAADYIREIEELPKIGVDVGPARMNWEVVSRRVWQKIDESKEILKYYQSAKNLDVYQGTAYFTAEKVLRVAMNDGSLSEEFTADRIFLPVGAHTNITPIDGLEEAGCLTSETLFGDKYPPKPYKSLVVMGGGPIGTEFAHVFAAAGTKVTLIQRNVRLLAKEDEDVSAQMYKSLRKLDIDIYLNRKPLSIRVENGEKVLAFEERTTGEITEVRAEEILLATGIRPNTDTLHLENTSVELDSEGWIRTNEFLETSAEGIWAFGDVNGEAPFRHKANYEADILVHNLFSGHKPHEWRWARYDVVPVVTFSYPQVAHVGLTEQQAIQAGYEVATAKHNYSSTAKGFALGFDPGDEHDGFVKLVVDKKSKHVLGMHVSGPQASILLQPYVNLLNTGETKLTPINGHIASPAVKELRSSRKIRTLTPQSVASIGETMTPHPSLSEVIMWVQYYFEDK